MKPGNKFFLISILYLFFSTFLIGAEKIVTSPLINVEKIKRGNKLLLCGFGVGYSLAAGIIE